MIIRIRKDFYKNIPVVLLFLAIFIFVSGNSDNPDMFATQYYYNNGVIAADAVFPSLLQKLSFSIGLNVFEYRILCYAIGFFFIIQGLKNCNINPASFWIMYAVYPMMMDAVQTDNFIAMGVLFYALTYYYGDSRKEKIRAAIWMIIAVGFHTAFIAYIPFLIASGLFKKRNIRIMIAFVVISSILATIFRNRIISLITVLLTVFMKGDIRVASYFSDTGHWGFLLFWCIHLMLILATFNAYKYTLVYQDDHKNRIVDVTYRMLVYAVLFFPLYAINSNFFRLSRDLLPLVIASVLQKPAISENQKKRRRNMVLLVFILSTLLILEVLLSNYDSIFIPFFSKNYIIWGN